MQGLITLQRSEFFPVQTAPTLREILFLPIMLKCHYLCILSVGFSPEQVRYGSGETEK